MTAVLVGMLSGDLPLAKNERVIKTSLRKFHLPLRRYKHPLQKIARKSLRFLCARPYPTMPGLLRAWLPFPPELVPLWMVMDCFWNLYVRCLNNCRLSLVQKLQTQRMSICQNLEELLQDRLHRPSSFTSRYYFTWFRAAELPNCFCVLSHGWAWLHCPSSPPCKYQLLRLGSLLRAGYSQTPPLLTVLLAMTCHPWPLCRSGPESHV